jgi:hypothetical protein
MEIGPAIWLDIDFIVEWICVTSGPTQFRVAPATLVFHGITDPRINIDWGRSGFQVSLNPASIDRVERELIQHQKVYLDRSYYRWRIGLNWPDSSEIAFGAVGFTQTLRAEPVLTERQHLSLSGGKRCLNRRNLEPLSPIEQAVEIVLFRGLTDQRSRASRDIVANQSGVGVREIHKREGPSVRCEDRLERHVALRCSNL